MTVRTILNAISVAVLLLGGIAAGSIYLLADDVPEPSGYTVPLQSDKMYLRELQRLGGKAAIVFDDLNRWFTGLWQGKALATTILSISTLASLAVFLIGRYLFPDR